MFQSKTKQNGFISRWPNWIGYVAVGWSLLYGFMHVYWLLGGKGYPFKQGDMGLFGAMITHFPSKVGGAFITILCFLGIFVGFIMQKKKREFVSSGLLLFYAWGVSFVFIFLTSDISLIMVMAYAFLFEFTFDWGMINQLICIIGALFWILAAISFQRRSRNACEFCGRNKEDLEPFVLVRWGRWLTIVAALAPVPYAITRFAWALHIPLGVSRKALQELSNINPMANLTEWVFGFLCIGGGILTLGLIQRWGEIFPVWFPFIGGKRVPIMLAVVPALIVAIAVTIAGFVFTFGFLAITLHLAPINNIVLGQIYGAVGPMIFWVPWGLTLGLSAIAYYYRRRGGCTYCG